MTQLKLFLLSPHKKINVSKTKDKGVVLIIHIFKIIEWKCLDKNRDGLPPNTDKRQGIFLIKERNEIM